MPGLAYGTPTMPDNRRLLPLLLVLGLGATLGACRPAYSPDDYSTRAVQQLNRVEQGVVVGVRRVTVTADGNTGAATGGAAGGILGSQAPGGNMAGAIGAVGGALVGGLLGTATERVAGDTTAFEYIIRKETGEMYTVTQREQTPLAIGQRVLMIGGSQARIVPDYTAPVATTPTPATTTPPAATPPATTPSGATTPAATPPADAPAAAEPARPPAEPIL
jgi:outer membrane lipoprotein SlyB